MIPDEIVEEVRSRADIVELVGEHVALKRAGKDFRALCPFHQERTPSFYVVPAKGFYKCFGCGEAGDVFSFLMKRLGLSFRGIPASAPPFCTPPEVFFQELFPQQDKVSQEAVKSNPVCLIARAVQVIAWSTHDAVQEQGRGHYRKYR